MGGRHSRPARHNQQQQDSQPQAFPPPSIYRPQPQGGYYGGEAHYPTHAPYYPPPPPPNTYFGPAPPPYYPPPPGAYHAGRMPTPYGANPPQIPQREQELAQTATIRNAVNLKKATLRLVPVNGDSTKLAVTFCFDASQPASVSTFFLVTEKPLEGCRLISKGPASGPILYEAGLNSKFPKDPAAPTAVIDVANVDDATLATHSRDEESYPLVIRLESVHDKAKADGATVADLRPGEPMKVWMQSQTTYAVILRDEEGNLVPKVVKQKIWVEGVSYELQEIYGMEHGSAAAKEAESVEDAEERLCVICLVNERDTTVLPCRHMCMCHECAQELRRQTSKCPICRNHVESLLHIKMQKGANAPVNAPATGLPASAAPQLAA